jgi:glutathione S-transferase
MMLTLHQTPAAWGIPNPSPFCVKLETYLRMADIPYRTARPSVRGMPKGKVPYVVDGGRAIGDSGLIIQHLVETRGDPLDGGLDGAARTRGHLVRRMVEEHLYFAVAHLRWSSRAAWPHLVEAFSPLFPPLLKRAGTAYIRRGVLKHTHHQGVGRHSHAEVLALVAADLDALSAVLGDNQFLLGERPTSIDATGYGFLLQIHRVPWESEEKELLRARPSLVGYLDRMAARYWAPDVSAASDRDPAPLPPPASARASAG